MRRVALLGPLALAACVTQPDLDATPFQRQFSLAENYQAVYARTNAKMRECLLAGSAFGTGIVVDGQLYSDLGYGEVQAGYDSFGYSPAALVRIDREGEGARVSIKVPTPTPPGYPLDWYEYYARGGQRCPAALEPPPAL